MFDAIEAPSHVVGGEAHPFVRLGAADAARIASFVAGLGEEALQKRFDRYMSAAMVRGHYDAMDWTAGVVLAWMGAEGIEGVVETHFYGTGRGLEAETALCVGEGWRDREVGRRLMERALAEAAERGAWRSVVVTGAGDFGLGQTVRGLGGTLEAGSGLGVIVH